MRFAGDADAGERAALRADAQTDFEQRLPVPGLQLLTVERGQSTTGAINELERSEDVLYAEPNFRRSNTLVPNDPYFRNLWGLDSTGQVVAGRGGTADADIDAPEAWDASTGSPEVKVAVVDSGVEDQHPDLRDQIWRNPGEAGAGKEANGVDDDSNGLVDDWRGWDWVDADNSPQDANGHGTHVSGTIAAEGNDGSGVVGVAWRSNVMPLRVLDAQGSGSVADLISAYRYAATKGAKIVNASLGGTNFSQAELDAIKAAPGTLFAVAAGNGGRDGVGDNNETTPEYPCSYTAANVVCVAASDRRDSLAAFSNFGTQSVDLAAPGTDILSDQPGGSFAFYDGTSMATPHVAGTAALVWAARPDASVTEVKLALLGGADSKPGLVGKTLTGGRLNARNSLGLAAPGAGSTPVLPPPAPAPAPTTPRPAPPPTTTSPAPASQPAARDVTPPVTLVNVRRRQRLRTLRRRGASVRLRCLEGCAIRSRLEVSRRTARKLGLRVTAGGAVVVGRGEPLALTRAGSTGFRLRLSRRANGKLRRVRGVRLTLRIASRDAGGNTRIVKRTIVARR